MPVGVWFFFTLVRPAVYYGPWRFVLLIHGLILGGLVSCEEGSDEVISFVLWHNPRAFAAHGENHLNITPRSSHGNAYTFSHCRRDRAGCGRLFSPPVRGVFSVCAPRPHSSARYSQPPRPAFERLSPHPCLPLIAWRQPSGRWVFGSAQPTAAFGRHW